MRILPARRARVCAALSALVVAALSPMISVPTASLMPPAAAAGWRQEWDSSPAFRRLLRRMTLAFGLAFLGDAEKNGKPSTGLVHIGGRDYTLQDGK